MLNLPHISNIDMSPIINNGLSHQHQLFLSAQFEEVSLYNTINDNV